LSEAFDIEGALKAGFERGTRPQTLRPSPLLIETDAWLEQHIAPRPWVAPGMLLRGAVTVVVGEPAAGKSMLMVGWAAGLVLGQEYGRLHPVAPCTVLTYNTEDDQDEQRRRFSAQLRSIGKRPADLSPGLIRISTDGIGTLLSLTDGCLTRTPAMEQLEALIDERRPDVVILDPLVELHEAEENDNTAVRSVMAHFRSLAIRYHMAVVLLHHTRKGSTGIAGNPDIARGASSVIGAARVVLTVSVMTEQEADTFSIPADHRRFFSRVDGAKINAAPIGREEWFERHAYSLDNGDQTAAMLPWTAPEDVISQDILARIQIGVEKGSPVGPWSPKLSKDARSIKNLLVEHEIMTASGQRKAVDALLAAGFGVATYRRQPSGRGQGLRSPEGLPADANWLSDADE